jgi:hypothetical protein
MRSIPSVALIVGLVACASAAPLQLGDYQAIAPRIDAVAKEGVPLHVQVGLARPENVAVFFVVPGRGATLLYPVDSTSPTRLTAGAHILSTSLADRATRDSDDAAHPNTTGAPLPLPNVDRRSRAATVMTADSMGGLTTEGFLLLYATDDALDYNKLVNRVTGITIPIEKDAAISTVTKLIKGTTSGLGSWAAYSSEFVSPGGRDRQR